MEFKEFVNPKAMLTPGIAGGIIMFMSDTLWKIFALPSKWSAIVLSFLLAFAIFKQYAAPIVEKYVYTFFNGLLILCVAMSYNYIGNKATIKSSSQEFFGITMSASYHDNGKIGLEIDHNDNDKNSARRFFDDWF
jgi:hypothetical protein